MFLKCSFILGTVFYTGFLVLGSLGFLLGRSRRSHNSKQKISVIIAAKNEASNLPVLFESLRSIDYPKDLYEVIIVLDHCTDQSLEFINSAPPLPNLRVIDFQGVIPGLCGKKAAIHLGISSSMYDLLVFTDADCAVPNTWLTTINEYFHPQLDYLLCYSVMQRSPTRSTFRLKNFERSIYYALAAAGMYFRYPITSSACNMAYRKSVFQAVNGFDGIGHVPSGDDDLLLMKMMPRIRFARISTDPGLQVVSYDGTNRSAHHQTNIRRASKLRYFPIGLKTLAILIFTYFIIFYLSLGLLPTKDIQYWVALKTLGELLISGLILSCSRRLHLLALYPAQIILFPLQFIYYAIRGTLGKYRWK